MMETISFSSSKYFHRKEHSVNDVKSVSDNKGEAASDISLSETRSKHVLVQVITLTCNQCGNVNIHLEQNSYTAYSVCNIQNKHCEELTASVPAQRYNCKLGLMAVYILNRLTPRSLSLDTLPENDEL